LSPEVLRSKIRGCLLGGAIGDLGILEPAAGIEDQEHHANSTTQLSLFCAEGMIRANLRASLKGIGPVYSGITAHAYLRWLVTQGITSATLIDGPRGWLLDERKLHARRVVEDTLLLSLVKMTALGQTASNRSKGHGAVARVAPIGLFFASSLTHAGTVRDLEMEVFDTAMKDASITHGHLSAQLSAGFFALLVTLICLGADLGEAVDACQSQLLECAGPSETYEAVRSAKRLASMRDGTEDIKAAVGQGKSAPSALAIAIYCAACTSGAHEAMARVAKLKVGTHVGSMVGNIVGAQYGEKPFRNHAAGSFDLRGIVTTMADDLVAFPTWELGQWGEAEGADAMLDRYPPS